MSKDAIVAVVCGGSSAEAEVSRSSAKAIKQALSATYSNLLLFEFDKALPLILVEKNVDVVFPVLHGPPGEDGTFQGFLEILGIPYVGSGVLASACAMNKIIAKQIFRTHGLPLANDTIVYRSEDRENAAKRVIAALGPNVVVKPSRQGSALGVSFASNRETLLKAFTKAFEFNEEVLVEQRIMGKEITVAILEKNDQAEALPVIEVSLPPGAWYDYEHRYTPGLSEHIIPAGLTNYQNHRCQEIAAQAHIALGCRDLSRADFAVAENQEPVILEVNTLPGMTPTSLYPDAAKAAGFSFEKLVSHLVERALSRKIKTKKLVS